MLIEKCDQNDIIYKLCEACILNYETTLNEAYIDLLLETDSGPQLKPNATDDEIAAYVINRTTWEAEQHSKNPFESIKYIDELDKNNGGNKMLSRWGQPQLELVKTNAFWNHKTTKRITQGLLAGALAAGVTEGIHSYKNKPHSVIAKKIAALRGLLLKYQKKMNLSKNNSEKSLLKKVCYKIMNTIDTLLKFLQKKTDKYFR